jgi:hypothetical protein
LAKSTLKDYLFKLGIRLEFFLKRSRPFVYRTPHKKKLFFPGCALVSAGPEVSLKTWEYLKKKDPETGMWMDCCGMPLTKFINKEASRNTHEDLIQTIRNEGIEEIITSCGNCAVEFKGFIDQIPSLKITSLYDILSEDEWPHSNDLDENYFVHHPCSARIDRTEQKAFQKLSDQLGLKVQQPNDKKYPLACCLSHSESAHERIDAVKDQNLLTYCGHCTRVFQNNMPSTHVLELVFQEPETMVETSKVNRFFRYFNFIRKSKKLERAVS